MSLLAQRRAENAAAFQNMSLDQVLASPVGTTNRAAAASSGGGGPSRANLGVSSSEF